MRILAIETTDQSGSVAALDNSAVLAAVDLDAAMRSAQSLSPAVVELLRNVGWKPADVQLVAVAVGPGSFTGLRVGVTTAKMFAYAVGAEVMGVNTLEAIAWQAPGGCEKLWTIIDAQRQQVFAGRFRRTAEGHWQWLGETMLLDDKVWLGQLSAGEFVSGPGLTKLVDRLPAGVVSVDQTLWQPKAWAVGQLAFRQDQLGKRDDIWTLVPKYHRLSAAEEKRRRELAQ